MRPKKLIIAGNYREYKEYLWQSGENAQTSVFVSCPERLFGLRDVECVYYGTWWLRDDMGRIEREVERINFFKESQYADSNINHDGGAVDAKN